jgi:tRNA(fMet)-specific endonuclease VapC
MTFLLHRDTCSAWVRGVRSLQGHFLQHCGGLFTSAVTVMQLEVWLVRARTPTRYSQAYGALMQQISVLSVDEAVAHRAAGMATKSRHLGQHQTTVDLLMIGTAVVHGLTLVTHNTQRFAQVPGLTVVDWLAP